METLCGHLKENALIVQEVEHLVPNWWCCLGDLCGALFLEEVHHQE